MAKSSRTDTCWLPVLGVEGTPLATAIPGSWASGLGRVALGGEFSLLGIEGRGWGCHITLVL